MEKTKFKETEEKYGELKERLNNGEITPEEMKKELKKMMVLDETGNYWMIGGKTGKWYVYNGTDWKEGNPFEQEEPAAAAFTEEYAAADQDTHAPTAKADTYEEPVVETAQPAAVVTPRADIFDRDKTDRHTICKVCKSKISLYSIYCPVCGANQKELETSTKKAKARGRENDLLITSVKITSLIFFLGGLGLIAGVLLGAAFGVFNSLFSTLQSHLPDMLADTRGGLAGGLIFAAVGGITGFVASAVSAAALSGIYNAIAYIFGGIRFRVRQ